MYFYFSQSNNAYYNLALEEHLLKHSKEDILFCYINTPSVVVGRFQVAYREIDASFASRHDILIARRLSGGGTVYHDLGNLNYSYITSCTDQCSDYYDFFNQKTLDVLSHLGLKNLSFQRNNIFCEEKKISGVAQYKRGKRMVHHGTLLVDADLEKLRALFTEKDYYHSKGIASVSASVSNITSFVNLSMEDVLRAFESSCIDKSQVLCDNMALEQMAKYYSTLEWIFGKSPKYTIEKETLYIEVLKGQISKISHPQFSDLIGSYHCYDELVSVCNDVDLLF